MFLHNPYRVPTFFATPLVAICTLAWYTWKGPKNLQLFTASFVISAAYAISLYQVRGALFANLLAIIPLSRMVARARSAIHKPGAVLRDHLLFVFTCLISLPLVWGIAGFGLKAQLGGQGKERGNPSACATQEDMSALAAQPPGLVASISNLGSHMLLFTNQRALAAPYHRNQTGMLAGLKISTLPPAEAEKEVRAVGATIIAVCPANSETHFLVDRKTGGLLADLTKGKVPAFLEPVPGTQNAVLQLYRIKPET
jgi:hypothetical protein